MPVPKPLIADVVGRRWLSPVLVAAVVTCGCDGVPSTSRKTLAIEGGVDSPAALGYRMSRQHQNAALYLTHGVLQCSATLVADRVVVTASHCMVTNPTAWFKGEQEPVLVAPETISLIVAEEGKKVCELKVAQRTWHPATKLDLVEHYVILNDIAVLILEKSAVATCPHVLPIPLAPEAALAARVGDGLLTTGFGAKTQTLTPRRWAKLELKTVGFDNFIAKDVGKGFLIHGDSGGGSFVETTSGSWGLIGISSTVVKPHASLTNIGEMTSFIAKTVPAELWKCPAELSRGAVCRGSELLECRAGVYSTLDCTASGKTCVAASAGARCAVPLAADGGVDTGQHDARPSVEPAGSHSGCSVGLETRRPPGPPMGLIVSWGLWRWTRRTRRHPRR